jgi:histidinol-phosphate/aromatic aminotransferase/cobyric acid decarboxylase-like protein
VANALGLDGNSFLDLSQSLNPEAPDPVPIVGRHLTALRRYPDPRRAHVALAETMGVDQTRLLLTNGGAEAITLVTAELGGSVIEPEFGLHPRGEGPVWRSNPHNPTGLLAGPEERAAVWDEAFYPLATGHWTRGDEGVVVVGSLTKLLACPGLRAGYILADPQFIERCRWRQPTWSVNGLVASALPELLAGVDLHAWSASVALLRTSLSGVLSSHGLVVRPSDASWVLVEHSGLRERLAPHGILVRDCTSFGLAGMTRVAVPSPSGIEALDAALSLIDLEEDIRVSTARPTPPPADIR